MSNFKSGSGNLDFGESDNDTADEATEGATDETPPSQEKASEPRDSSSSDHSSSASTGDPSDTVATSEQYPYFVRRSNVGDERDTRLEIHVRDKVADHEAEFRNELAESLKTNEVSKTDAREFALLAAFQHPEKVAELMREEGFGTLG